MKDPLKARDMKNVELALRVIGIGEKPVFQWRMKGPVDSKQSRSARTSPRRSAHGTLPVTQSFRVGKLIAFLRLVLSAAMTRFN
ncbi:hypothetical protein [Caballeronia sp. dw_19]|uniref:hypothetical protein n=1 Tax=Caballeronia sp. dw_19 TaxID=2719791 RepID=UPI001BD46AF2|nr:hypothetical protein [Caballeronia sp. dw_19]